MNIYVCSDESGVFDCIHNMYYIYGGIIFIGKNEKDDFSRKYIAAEKEIIKSQLYENKELKATILKAKHKRSLFNLTKNYFTFGVVINQSKVNKNIFSDKKSKQRYLDYAYKIGLKDALKILIQKGVINTKEDINFIIQTDEHTTATNGCYELKECLLQEFKIGTINYEYNTFFPPILPNIKSLDVKYLNSAKKPLIRTADIIANRIYFEMRKNGNLQNIPNVIVRFLP
ncbi:MAG: DUF3800 domain-containing protein [Sphaerochaetaceae bacterium]|nr:DUF3800 domain-containing protein [Sphaerochaetaceae bacterium]